MADRDAAPPPLRLAPHFPPVPTEAWEAVIRQDLKGADYERTLVWRLDEGLTVKPYYRREDLPHPAVDARPGVFPFLRGTGETWRALEVPALPADAVRADALHDAGATAVQELAYAIAEGVDRLDAATGAGGAVDDHARALAFVFAVGSTYFLEIAKLRAARLLWAQAVAAFGPADPSSARMALHVRTSRANKSLADPYTNLLRATTEAMAGALGGADTVAVEAFGFEPHLATNVTRILAEEAHLDRVADPAGGSYFIEALTEALAAEAWRVFQQVEAEGGYARVRASGRIEAAIAEARHAREQAVALRRRTLVGVNDYPDPTGAPGDAGTLARLESPAPGSGQAAFGAPRLAEPFERIRLRTLRHAAATGRTPRVLLLTSGDVGLRTARANFCLNFFGCAGFVVIQADDPAEADLVVLCSSDPEYLALATRVVPQTAAPVLVAGHPAGQIDALRAVGVQGFVHRGSNAVETLTAWQGRLGMGQ